MSETSLSTYISREIENDILSGTFHQGERLDERILAQRFGVSRTPVREALSKIVSQGLAEHRARQGIFISKISLSAVFELFEMLAALESSAARLAARRLSNEKRTELLLAADETARAAESQNIISYTEANDSFHSIISVGSGNRPLQESIMQLRKRISPYRSHIHRIAGRTLLSSHEHVLMAQHISKGDEDSVSILMFRHLDMHRPEFSNFSYTLMRSLDEQLKNF